MSETRNEITFLTLVPIRMKEISKELKRANDLKEIELLYKIGAIDEKGVMDLIKDARTID